jgi:hypothetical protein
MDTGGFFPGVKWLEHECMQWLMWITLQQYMDIIPSTILAIFGSYCDNFFSNGSTLNSSKYIFISSMA